MAESNIIQMHDYAGNNQYPVTLASLVYDEDGETVGKKLALLLDWFEWGDDAHSSVKTKYHFWSEKQLGAGGIGEESEGGEGGIGTITGIFVNGVTYNEPDELGVLTIPDYPTSLEWANIVGKPTHLSHFTDDVVAGNYLPLTGGTIESAGIPLTIKRTNNSYSVISFYGIEDGTSQHFGYLGFSGVGEPIYMTSGGNERILIHSGNIGSYKAGDSDKLDGKHFTDIMNIGFDNTLDLDTLYSEGALVARYWVFANSSNISNQPWSNSAAQVWTLPGNYQLQIAKFYNSNDIRLRGRSGEGWTNWQRLAFTDSDITGYSAGLKHSNGTIGAIVNSYGNVTIGSSDLAGTNAKLYVDGSVYVGNVKVLDRVSKNLHIGEGIRGAFDTSIFGTNILFNTTSGDRAMMIAIGGNVGIGTTSPDEMLHVAGNIRLKNASNYGCYLKFGDSNYCYLYEDYDDHLKIYAGYGILLSTNAGYGVTIERTLTIGSAVLSWDSVNNALKIEGNVYTTGQLSAGGVGTEVQKVFDIAATSDAYTANQPYTATLTHSLNTYDLAVVVYEVEEIPQTDGTKTEKLTQVLADVTLTDENNVTVYFASRKIDKKYRIVIIG